MARLGHPVFNAIVAALAPTSAQTVVDLGCGAGPALKALMDAEPSLHLCGLDFNTEAVVAAQAALPEARIEVGDLNDRLPYGDRSIDLVLSHNVIECLDGPVALLDEVARVLHLDGRAVLSHTDFDGIMISGPDRSLTRRVLHAYADHPPAWTPTADGQMGRQLAGLVRSSRLKLVGVEVHLTTSTELAGDALARVDELAAALRDGVGDLLAHDVAEWRRQVDDAAARGRFLFCEPAFVVTARPC